MSALSDLLNRYIAGSDTFRDMSNRRMADRAGVSRGTIDNYRSGVHPAAPGEDVLQAFHELLGIPLAELREAAGVPRGEPEPYAAPPEFNRLSHAQRTALDEFVRSFVGPQGELNAMATTSKPDASPEEDQGEKIDRSTDNRQPGVSAAGSRADAVLASELQVNRPRHNRKKPS